MAVHRRPTIAVSWINNGAGLIDRDSGLKNDTLDPNEFAAVFSAVSLFDQAQMRKLVLEIGGAERLATYGGDKFDVGKSILITAVVLSRRLRTMA
jgi:hypothetical protein